MRSALLRASIIGLLAVFAQSCILSRLTDKAFLGFTVHRPTYSDRKFTAVLLLPITFAVDVATFPIQLIILAIAGDDFIVGHESSGPDAVPTPAYVENLQNNPRFQQLTAAQQKTAISEYETLLASGALDTTNALGLTEDGHWMIVALTGEARAAARAV